MAPAIWEGGRSEGGFGFHLMSAKLSTQTLQRASSSPNRSQRAVHCDSAHPKHQQGTTTTPEASPHNRSTIYAASHSPQRRPPGELSPGPSACDSWPADSDETNPALCSAGVLDSQAQCQPHVTRRRALRDYCARASESRRSRQREPACRPRCTPPPRRLVHRLPARAQTSG